MEATITSLTKRLWESIGGIYEQILKHPFIEGLTEGTLARDVFRFYVIQDAHYLREYARALNLLAARSPAEDTIFNSMSLLPDANSVLLVLSPDRLLTM